MMHEVEGYISELGYEIVEVVINELVFILITTPCVY